MAIISKYVGTALERADYKRLEDDSYCGTIPGLTGVIAFAETLPGCERELKSVLEEWVLLGLKLRHPLPVLDGIDLSKEPVSATLDSM